MANWGIWKCYDDGRLSLDDIDFMAGNVVNCRACATCCCFILFGVRCSGTPLKSLELPVDGESEEDED